MYVLARHDDALAADPRCCPSTGSNEAGHRGLDGRRLHILARDAGRGVSGRKRSSRETRRQRGLCCWDLSGTRIGHHAFMAEIQPDFARGHLAGTARAVVPNISVVMVTLGLLTLSTIASAGTETPRCFGRQATIVGTDRADVLIGTDRGDVIVGLDGRDVIRGGGGPDLICAGANLQPGATIRSIRRELVHGGDGDDKIRGGSGFDQLVGEAGDDEIWVGTAPVVTARDADGTYYLMESGVGGPGDDRLFGGRGFDFLEGNGGDDVVRAWAGSTDSDIPYRAELFGGHGDDLVVGGAGGDVVVGGPGDDVQKGRGGLDGLYDGNEGYRSHGGGHDVMMGGPGNDYLQTENGRDEVRGGAGEDEILGSNGPDRLFGGGGDDHLDGHDGDDLLSGGPGIDIAVHSLVGIPRASLPRRLHVDLAARLSVGFGTDTLRSIEGSEGQDSYGRPVGADVLLGDSGPNRFDRLSRGDRVDGRAGSDVVCLCPDEVQNEKGAVIDLQKGVARRHGYQVMLQSIEGARGTVGPDVLIGSAKSNHFEGDAGDDQLYGWGGRDVLRGGDGNDTIYGGSGFDDLDGGAGNNTIIDSQITAGQS